jgi:DNA gyrase subunit A
MAEEERNGEEPVAEGDQVDEDFDHGNIEPRSIIQEMKDSYLDYSMSVIVGRALPDVRDGLKPVHQRILYGMKELANTHDKPYKKSARVVGDVLGKYHPHGDTAVYDALVRMAQDFSLRYPLVDGQGNFGSVDGDNAAAMRYTECRMSRLASTMLQDIEKETVDFRPNFDATLEEPVVLPARLPNLLVNGSTGIAVGMATNIPPHNLREIIDGMMLIIEDPEVTLAELLEVVKGPDFPTGGIIHGIRGIVEGYSSGRGTVKIRAKCHFEDRGGGRERIVATELPYNVNKSRLIESIADLVRDKRIDGITDLRDESDRHGIRLVIELRRDVIGEVVLNQLYKHTDLQSSFGINNLALVDGRPQLMGLKEMMVQFIRFREEVVRRRTAYDLRKAEEKAHVLEGLVVALDNLDEVIALIRGSPDVQTASTGLQERFELTEVQAKAILEMRLQKLTSMEVDKVREDLAETLKLIAQLREILDSEELVLGIVREELEEVKDRYGDDRRTQIDFDESELAMEDLVPNVKMVVSITSGGYIKRQDIDSYRVQRRGGKGLRGQMLKETDYVEDLFVAWNHSYLLIFTNLGRVYWLKTFRIPESSRHSRGVPVVNLLPGLQENEHVVAFRSVKKEFDDDHYLFFATKRGKVKKTVLSAYGRPRVTGIYATKIEEGDELVAVRLSDGDQDVLLATKNGQTIRFLESDVRPMGRVAAGVRGIRLREGDEVVSMALVKEGTDVLTVTRNGYGKRTLVDDYRLIKRGGYGVRGIITSERNGPVVAVRMVDEGDELMITSQEGMIVRIPVYENVGNQIRCMSRNTQGVRLMRLSEDDRVICIGVLREADEAAVDEQIEDEGEETPPALPEPEE